MKILILILGLIASTSGCKSEASKSYQPPNLAVVYPLQIESSNRIWNGHNVMNLDQLERDLSDYRSSCSTRIIRILVNDRTDATVEDLRKLIAIVLKGVGKDGRRDQEEVTIELSNSVTGEFSTLTVKK